MNSMGRADTVLPDRVLVAVVGGGQAGLSISWHLTAASIAHVVLERHRIGHAWRSQRWDSFCLVTPNWQCQLPGFPYPGDDPHGFMPRDAIVGYIEAYAASFGPPVHEGVGVTSLRAEAGGFRLETSAGSLFAGQVVIATGGYHKPVLPRLAERLDPAVKQLHSSGYRNPDDLPPGDVLVVGTGQSGCQIAEDLHIAGRRVHLCVGGAPRVARRYRGRDVVDWLHDMGHYDMPVHEHKLKERVRGKTNHYVTGRDGGRDIDLRQRALEGMRLYGRLIDVADGELRFDTSLRANLDAADRTSETIKDSIDAFIAARGIAAPAEARYRPVWEPKEDITTLDYRAADIAGVVWSMGFGTDYAWVELPVFDGRGQVVHARGVTPVEGVYVLGLPWLYTWGSGRFSGVARDAAFLAERITARIGGPHRAGAIAFEEAALGS